MSDDRPLFPVDPGSRRGVPTCAIAEMDPTLVSFMGSGRPCGELVRAWTIDGTSIQAVAAVVQLVKSRGGRLLIERQFPTIRSGANPMDLEKVIETRVVFSTLATIMRVDFELVYPSPWQTILRKHVPLTPEVGKVSAKTGKMKHDTKKAAAWLVRQLYPGFQLNKHEADAVLMGRWDIERKLGT